MEKITKQKIGLFVITAGLGVGVITCNGNLFDMKTANADPAIQVDANITFDSSASIRVDDDAIGIRFKAHMGKDIYDNFVSNGIYKNNVELGMIVIPQAAYDAFNKQSTEKDYFAFLNQYGKEKGAISIDFPASKIYKEDVNDYSMSCVIDLANDHYALKYQAVVYYSIDGGNTYTYSNRSDSRSFVCLADELLSSSTTNLNDEQIKKLNFIKNKYDVASAHDFVDNVCTICHGEERLNFNSLDEFNNLDAINTATEVVNVDLTNKNFEANGLIIGNKNIADLQTFKNTSELIEYEKENVVGTKNGTLSILNTAKKGQTFIINGGAFEGAKGCNPNNINETKKGYIGTNLPDGATLIFDGTTFKGAVAIIGEWQQIAANGYTQESQYPHKLDKIILRNCTFDDGALFQNGGFAKELVIDNCDFKQFNNNNDSNPIWFINAGAKNMGWYIGEPSKVTIKNSRFTSTRPIKLYEQSITGASLEITNNTFNLIDDGNVKNDAIIFSTTSGASNNIKITGNTINGALALMAFSQTPSMEEGATFIAKDNILNGAKIAVKWKSTEDYDVDFAETDIVKVSSNDNFAASLTNALVNEESATFSLAEGEFTLKNTNKKYATDKDVTFIGKGNGKTIYKNEPKGTSGESNADYSFDGTKSVTFKNMTIELGNGTFNGFIRPKSLTFENCIINGMGSYWGTGKVTFKNSVFNTTSEYNLWLYSGKSFEFNNCTFNSSTGKFAHAYKTENGGVTNATFNGCKFIGTEKTSKAAVNIKKYKGNVWNIVMNDTTLDGVTCGATDKVSDLYYVNNPEDTTESYDYSELTVTIDNVLVWKGASAISAPVEVEVSSNDNLASSIEDTLSSDVESATFNLAEGEFSLKNTNKKYATDKDIAFVGADKTKTIYKNEPKGIDGEANADYSFDGTKSVTFKNMTIELGNENYNGFVRMQNLTFENCIINGRGSYWGTGKAIFKDCTFNATEDYNIWLYSGESFEFDNCTFNSTLGKFINAYKEQAEAEVITNVTIKNCKFIGTNVDKAAVNVKNQNNANWNVTISDTTLENVACGASDKVSDYFYVTKDSSADYSTTTITINNEIVWANNATVTK